MSDDKKRARDRALQRRVRERQAKTGESYQAAWRQLTDSTSDETALSRVSTKIPPLDFVLGGGLVTASVVLLAGSPGTGRTVLTLQTLKGCEHPCLYVTTEETREQVAVTAERIGAVADWIYVSAERNLAKILEHAHEVGAQMIAIDTIQKIACEDIDDKTGTRLQVRTCVDRLVAYAKTTGTTLWLVGHVTSDGDLANKTIEHSVDVVLKLNQGERFGGAERNLRSDKNRFGRSEVTTHFEFTAKGFIPVDNDRLDALRSSDDALSADAQSSALSRLIIPLHLDRVPPHQATRVTARASNGAVDIERLFLSAAGTPGGTADWIVNDVEIDGQSQLAHKDLPGALFGSHGGAAGRATATLAFQGFDPVERDHELALIVTYVGPNLEGIPFFASAVGTKPAQRPTVVPITSKAPLDPLVKTTLRARVQNAPFQIARIEIEDGDTTGGAADWIVNDIKIDDRSQFVQSGDIPGDMFATNAIDNFIAIEPCEPGLALEIDVTYIGSNTRGAIFTARVEGTVLRDDYSLPPPDLHVVVETAGRGPGDTVVATCNWRAPASDNRTR